MEIDEEEFKALEEALIEYMEEIVQMGLDAF